MQRYIRLAGIEITGATEVLKFYTPQEVVATAAEIFSPKAKEQFCG